MTKLDINEINLIALYTGDKGYSSCACKCPCCSQSEVQGNYQGNLEQIYLLLEKFSKLKQLYLFGNPDIVVDTDFCNQVSKIAINKGINVCYSTSGIGGIPKLEQLLNGIESKYVDYVSFSIDSMDKDKMSMLKGVNYPFERAIDGIKWAVENDFKPKIQPTLWSSNYMDVYSIIEYFASIGVKVFTFHIGSVEKNSLDTHQHLTPEQMMDVHKQIDAVTHKYKVKVTCPTIYPSCGDNNIHKWYCMNPQECHNWLVYLKENGIFATHVPVLSELDNKFFFDITKPIYVEELAKQDFCPSSNKAAKCKTLCRFIAKTWNE